MEFRETKYPAIRLTKSGESGQGWYKRLKKVCEKEKITTCQSDLVSKSGKKPCIRPKKIQERHLLITPIFFMYLGMNILMSKRGQHFLLV